MITDERIHQFDSSLRDLLGIRTSTAPLNASVESSEHVDGITRSLIRCDVDQRERIGAYLLVPDAAAGRRLPAVLAIHQHGGDFELGKSEPAGLAGGPEFHYGWHLAQRGYVVLCPDMLAFEERVPPPEVVQGDEYKAGYWNERFEAMRLFLYGSSLQGKYLADLSRSLDYLAGLECVDPERIGCIGHSMGGQEAAWMTWLDKRIKAGASSCGFAMISAILRDRINHNMALYVPGMLPLGDMDLLIAGIAPRPFFFSAGDQDVIFPIDSVRHISESAGAIYAAKGVPDAIQCAIFEGGHGFPEAVRQQAYGFLDRHLALARADDMIEPAQVVQVRKELQES